MSTHRVNVDEVRDQLSDVITAASEGSEVIIEENGKPPLVSATDSSASKFFPTAPFEFATDEDALAWDVKVGRTSRETRRDSIEVLGLHR